MILTYFQRRSSIVSMHICRYRGKSCTAMKTYFRGSHLDSSVGRDASDEFTLLRSAGDQ